MERSEQIFEGIVSNQMQSLRYDAGLRAEVLGTIDRLADTIAGGLAIHESLTPAESRMIIREAKREIDAAYSTISATQRAHMIEFAKAEQEAIAALFRKVDAVAEQIANIERIIDKAIIQGAPSAEWWARQAEDFRQRFTDTIRTGMAQGESTAQMARRVRGTKALKFKDGIAQIARNNAEALVRTSVQQVGADTRMAFFEDNEGLIAAYQHVSVLDGRTSTSCIVRDGLRWKARGKQPIGHNLPFSEMLLHWNCRRVLVPLLRGEKDLGDAKRASMDGQVSANTNFEDFMNNKGRDFQDDVLGVGKAKLWREGKISLTQLLDQRGNTLTLTELRQKYGV